MRGRITEGIAVISSVLPRGNPGPYQIQAAIAAVHDEAPTAEETDWAQIRALYELLMRLSDNPVVALNYAVAVSMVDGPQAGLGLLATLDGDPRMAADPRLPAVRAHLLELAVDTPGAISWYRTAAARSMSPPQQRYLYGRAARLSPDGRVRGESAF